MTYRIVTNRKNLSTTILFTANTTLNIAGVAGVSGDPGVSDIAIEDEIITGAAITEAWYGSQSANAHYWQVARGSNTVAIYDGTGWIDYAGNGNSLTLDASSPLVVTLSGGVGTLMLQLKKIGEFSSEYLVG